LSLKNVQPAAEKEEGFRAKSLNSPQLDCWKQMVEIDSLSLATSHQAVNSWLDFLAIAALRSCQIPSSTMVPMNTAGVNAKRWNHQL